jgi:hypothetical protein
MLKTGDELRATNRERVRRCRTKQAKKAIKHTDQERIVQFTITVRLPVVSIRRVL